METLIYTVSSSLPMSIAIFVGSYFGLWKKRNIRLPIKDKIILFFSLWALATILIMAFKLLLSGQSDITISSVGGLWGPLIIGVIIGRSIVDRRFKAISNIAIKKSYESNNN